MAGTLRAFAAVDRRGVEANNRILTTGTANAYGLVFVADVNGWVQSATVSVAKVLANDPNPVLDIILYRKVGTSYAFVAQTATLTLTDTAQSERTLTFPTKAQWLSGETYALVLRVVSGQIEVQERETTVSDTGRLFVSGGLGAGVPASSWTPAQTGTAASEPVGLAINGYLNVVPTATVTSPVANLTSNVVPAFTVSMTDSDRAEFGDSIRTAWLHIVGDSGGGPNLTNVRYGPQATAIANADGAGTGSVRPAISLPAGIYWVRMAASDRFGATSAFTPWQRLTSAASANVQAAGTLAGSKQEVITGIAFPWTYTNPAGFNAASIQVELYQGATRIRQSAPIAITWAPGSTNTITWAQLVTAGLAGGGAWTDLQWGQEVGYQAVLTDSQGTISPPYTRRTFITDAAPTIPYVVSPKGDINLTSRPNLRVITTDADDSPAELTVIGTMRNDATNAIVMLNQSFTYHAPSGEFRYQTTTANLPNPGPGTRVDYRWNVGVFDGTLYAGVFTDPALQTYSLEEHFSYTAGPAVTIAQPTDGGVIGTGNPVVQIAWIGGTASQVNFTFRDIATEQTGTWGLPIGTYTSPVNVTHGGQQLYDGHRYEYIGHVIVAGVQGDSEPITVTLDYPPYPAPLNFRATPYTMDRAPFPTLIQLAWDPTTYGAGQFVRYVVTARREGEPEGGPNERTIASITDPASTMCFDGFPVSGVVYRYTLRQTVVFGNDTIPSELSERTTGVVIRGVCLSVASDPTNGVVYLFDGDLPSWEPVGFEDVRTPFGSATPVTWVRALNYSNLSAGFPLRTGPLHPMTATQIRDRTLAIRRQVLCFRSRDGERFFCRFPVNSPSYQRVPGGNWDLSVQLRQEQWREIPVGTDLNGGVA